MISIRRVSTTSITILGGRVSSETSRAGGNAGMRHMISVLTIRTSSACIVCGSFPSRAGSNAFLAAQVRSVVGAVLVCRSAQQHLLVNIAVPGFVVGCAPIRAGGNAGMGFMISILVVSTSFAILGVGVSSMTSRAGGNTGMRHMISILAIRTSIAVVLVVSIATLGG